MSALAIVPARGGSKRIPGKNIRDFAGRPILAWPVETALNSGLFDTIMVSTDDDAVADVARAAGAEVPFLRSAATADDHATLLDVLREVVTAYEAAGRRFDTLCCILPTAALLKVERLREGRDLLAGGAFDRVFPVVAFGSPIQRALRRGADGLTGMMDATHHATRSQDLEPAYHDAGQFYWMTRDACMAGTPMFSGRAGSLVMDETEVQDIDTETDWRMAEVKRQMLGADGP